MSLEEKERECSLSLSLSLFFVWAQLGSNQRPPDYESGAANHLSYGPLQLQALNLLLDRVLRSLGVGGPVLPRASFGWLTPLSFCLEPTEWLVGENKFVVALQRRRRFYDIVN